MRPLLCACAPAGATREHLLLQGARVDNRVEETGGQRVIEQRGTLCLNTFGALYRVDTRANKFDMLAVGRLRGFERQTEHEREFACRPMSARDAPLGKSLPPGQKIRRKNRHVPHFNMQSFSSGRVRSTKKILCPFIKYHYQWRVNAEPNVKQRTKIRRR